MIENIDTDETELIIRTHNKNITVVRDNKYSQYKSYIHIKQYRIVNDEQEGVLIATPKLEISYNLKNHTTSYWYMDIFPYLDHGRQFHKMIKRLELSNKQYIHEKFGNHIEYKSCLVNKKKVHPRMSLSLPMKDSAFTFKTYINQSDTIDFTDIQKEDQVVLLIRMKDLYINTDTNTAGCNWELVQVRVSRFTQQCLLLDKHETNALQIQQQSQQPTMQLQQIQQMLQMFQQLNPSIVMNTMNTMNTMNNNTVHHTNVMNVPPPQPRSTPASTSSSSSSASTPMAMIPQLKDILSIKNNLKSVDRTKHKKREVPPLRDFPTQQDLDTQRKELKCTTNSTKTPTPITSATNM